MNLEDITYTNRGIKIEDNYIFSDIHIGYYESVKGMIKSDQMENINDRLQSTLKNRKIQNVIIAGDIFHDFKKPTDEHIDQLKSIRSIVRSENCNLILITGNHDNVSGNISDLNFYDEYILELEKNKVAIGHGHKDFEKNADLYVVGHLHPVLNINGVKWPIYLYGKNTYRQSDVLILPAFSSYQDGVVISDNMNIKIDFPIVNNKEFGELKPLVYDNTDDSVKEFPVLSKYISHFG